MRGIFAYMKTHKSINNWSSCDRFPTDPEQVRNDRGSVTRPMDPKRGPTRFVERTFCWNSPWKKHPVHREVPSTFFKMVLKPNLSLNLNVSSLHQGKGFLAATWHCFCYLGRDLWENPSSSCQLNVPKNPVMGLPRIKSNPKNSWMDSSIDIMASQPTPPNVPRPEIRV